jgi:hypothetical protein
VFVIAGLFNRAGRPLMTAGERRLRRRADQPDRFDHPVTVEQPVLKFLSALLSHSAGSGAVA